MDAWTFPATPNPKRTSIQCLRTVSREPRERSDFGPTQGRGQGHPETTQHHVGRPKSHPGRLRTAQEPPKSHPRTLKTAQEPPKSRQEAPRGAQKARNHAKTTQKPLFLRGFAKTRFQRPRAAFFFWSFKPLTRETPPRGNPVGMAAVHAHPRTPLPVPGQ